MNIEIQVLHVDEKTLTKWMYRQLPYEGLIDHGGAKLKGQPLGYVDCTQVDSCTRTLDFEGPNHRHVLWERDGELFRCLVEQNELPPDFSSWNFISAEEQLKKYQRWMKSQRAAWKIIAGLKQIFLVDCPKPKTVPKRQDEEETLKVDWA